MAKKATNKKANITKDENLKDTVLDVENAENVENTTLDTEKDEDTGNTILDVEKKDSDIIRKALEEEASNVNNEDVQNQAITSEEKVEQVKPNEDNVKIEDSQSGKMNSANKVKTAKRKISKLFGYYWNGQMMD